MTDVRLAAAALAFAAVGLTATACAPTEPADEQPRTSQSTAPTEDSALPSGVAEEAGTRLEISVGNQVFEAMLEDGAASRDLLEQLPLTVEMADHSGVEKTGPLPAPLSLDGQPSGADPDIGDVGYYAPGNDVVLYYGDQSSYDGIVVLGQLVGDAAQRLAQIDGAITATIEVLDD